MITDSIAQKLEDKGLWRRAATRWGEVMMLVDTDKEREAAARRRELCIRKSRRIPEPSYVTFGDVRKAADRTLTAMGIQSPQDEVWRNYQTDDNDGPVLL